MKKNRLPFAHFLSIVLFFIVIAIPLGDDLFHFSKKVKLHPLQEKRGVASKPVFQWSSPFSFPAPYTAYYNDHFNFRNLLIYAHNLLRTRLFSVSPLDSVLLGRDGWLFYARESHTVDEMDYYRAVKPFSPGELEHWRLTLEERRRLLEQQGIRHLLVIAPNKSTIYPEKLPARIHPPQRPNRLDQLLDYLKTRSPVSVLDLRPALLKAKNNREGFHIYHKTDSHWNDYGAYIASTEILNHFSPQRSNTRPLPLQRFCIVPRNRVGGDLAILLYMQKREFREERIGFHPTPPFHARPAPLNPHIPANPAFVATESPSATLPRAILVHDSFAEALKPWLADHFSRLVSIHDWNMGFYPNVIAAEKPAIVIDEMAERFLMDKIISNSR